MIQDIRQCNARQEPIPAVAAADAQAMRLRGAAIAYRTAWMWERENLASEETAISSEIADILEPAPSRWIS